MFLEAQLINTSIICCYGNYPMGMWFTDCVEWYCALLHQESCLAQARCLLYFTTQLYKDYLLTSGAWTIVNTAMHTTSMYTPQEVKEPLPYTHSPTCSSLTKKSITGKICFFLHRLLSRWAQVISWWWWWPTCRVRWAGC